MAACSEFVSMREDSGQKSRRVCSRIWDRFGWIPTYWKRELGRKLSQQQLLWWYWVTAKFGIFFSSSKTAKTGPGRENLTGRSNIDLSLSLENNSFRWKMQQSSVRHLRRILPVPKLAMNRLFIRLEPQCRRKHDSCDISAIELRAQSSRRGVLSQEL